MAAISPSSFQDPEHAHLYADFSVAKRVCSALDTPAPTPAAIRTLASKWADSPENRHGVKSVAYIWLNRLAKQIELEGNNHG